MEPIVGAILNHIPIYQGVMHGIDNNPIVSHIRNRVARESHAGHGRSERHPTIGIPDHIPRNLYAVSTPYIDASEVVDDVVIAKPGFGYGNIRLNPQKEKEALELLGGVVA